ncbi:MAG: amino acid aminotransferase [Pseudomonadota bacterium]
MIFADLQPAKADGIMAVMQAFRADPREYKLDLGAGVYLDESGHAPVMQAYQQGEQRLLKTQTTKAYVGVRGSHGFCQHIADLALGPELARSDRQASFQTTGGSGALRILAELIALTRPGCRIWMSDPTWPNHAPIMQAAGLEQSIYPYFDSKTGSLRFDAMMQTLRDSAVGGDIILLHASCHNPTGVNPSLEQWQELASMIAERGLVPFFDNAYQGFGDGLDQDRQALQIMAAKVPEMLIAGSCSKNFACYRERTGYATIIADHAKLTNLALQHALAVARAIYSMPPDHGAHVVQIILGDPQLRTIWRKELGDMRQRMLDLRKGLADRLRIATNTSRFDFLAHHRGMFSQTGLGAVRVQKLASDFAIYLVGEGRMNIAGLREDRLDDLATAIARVL